MSKGSGGTRILTPTAGTMASNREIFSNDIQTPGVIPDRSYFSEVSGAYSIYMEGHNYVAEEVEAARILADEGYITILTPENISIYSTRKKGDSYKFPDGIVSGAIYEQSTPNPDKTTPEGRAKSINNALQHARDKGARVAMIFDKHQVFHKEDIDAGIRLFSSKNKYKFDGIITINTVHKKRVNEWFQ